MAVDLVTELPSGVQQVEATEWTFVRRLYDKWLGYW
jgi:hypothetical protein